ncbi:hypothetical protein ABFX02_14G252500 [Erythranthe guttata]
MITNLNSVFFALSLLFLIVITAEGRKIEVSTTSSTSSVENSTCATHRNDVEGLVVLIGEFPQLAGEKFPSATRDPCSPHKLTWISCTDDPICRVTALQWRG